ncbi:MAG: hypothetical protein KDK96_01110 [Chlamydiia bacterium]|nr:hypothetical protein [Chlamydiia bacterium]
MKKYLGILFSLLFLFGCERPKGFTLKKITSNYEPSEKWEVTPTLSEETLLKILDQPYIYLGSGNHTYAFESFDGKFVIKFFKQKHMRIQTPFLSQAKIEKRKNEREESFNSYIIAYTHLKEETGLLFLHLNKTNHLGISLKLIDQHGTSTEINLDEMEFLIQKRASLAFDYLGTLIEHGAYGDALIGIRSLLNVVAKRNQMGIYDKDLQFFKNFGFINGQAVEIDIGEYKIGVDVPNTYEELLRLSYQISEFVGEKAPALVSVVESEMNEIISQYKPKNLA